MSNTRTLWLMVLIFTPILSFADPVAHTNPSDLGIAASNVNSVVAFIYDIVDVILYIGAAILGVSGLLKYRLHRRNPQQVPLSTPVTEISIAGVLVLLGLLAQMSTSYHTVKNPNLPTTVLTPKGAPPPAHGGNQYPH